MGHFHAKALRDLGYFVTTVDPYMPADLPGLPSDLGGYDVAAVATPPDLLGFYGVACADAGLKTLIEKPLAPSLLEARAIAEAQTPYWDVCIGFIERYNPQVRALKERLPLVGKPHTASFVRWNDRPTNDLKIDLRIHDVDLAHFLGLECKIGYLTAANAQIKMRLITITGDAGEEIADLMDHDTSPLHALWHAFLTGQDVPRIEDAIRAHEALVPCAEAMA